MLYSGVEDGEKKWELETTIWEPCLKTNMIRDYGKADLQNIICELLPISYKNYLNVP